MNYLDLCLWLIYRSSFPAKNALLIFTENSSRNTVESRVVHGQILELERYPCATSDSGSGEVLRVCIRNSLHTASGKGSPTANKLQHFTRAGPLLD